MHSRQYLMSSSALPTLTEMPINTHKTDLSTPRNLKRYNYAPIQSFIVDVLIGFFDARLDAVIEGSNGFVDVVIKRALQKEHAGNES